VLAESLLSLALLFSVALDLSALLNQMQLSQDSTLIKELSLLEDAGLCLILGALETLAFLLGNINTSNLSAALLRKLVD
jgi:hypothetical protein